MCMLHMFTLSLTTTCEYKHRYYEMLWIKRIDCGVELIALQKQLSKENTDSDIGVNGLYRARRMKSTC